MAPNIFFYFFPLFLNGLPQSDFRWFTTTLRNNTTLSSTSSTSTSATSTGSTMSSYSCQIPFSSPWHLRFYWFSKITFPKTRFAEYELRSFAIKIDAKRRKIEERLKTSTKKYCWCSRVALLEERSLCYYNKSALFHCLLFRMSPEECSLILYRYWGGNIH